MITHEFVTCPNCQNADWHPPCGMCGGTGEITKDHERGLRAWARMDPATRKHKLVMTPAVHDPYSLEAHALAEGAVERALYIIAQRRGAGESVKRAEAAHRITHSVLHALGLLPAATPAGAPRT